MDSESHDHDRQDALLTSTQRKRLSTKNYNPKHRQRIRDRVRNGSQDLAILREHLEERDIKQIFESEDDNLGSQQRENIINAIGFFLRVADVCSVETEKMLEEAVRRAYSQQRPSETIGDVSIDVDADDREQAVARARQKLMGEVSETLSAVELRATAETDYTQLAPLSRPVSGPELKQLVQNNIDQIVSEGDVIEQPPATSQRDSRPDLIVRNEQGKIVIIEIAVEIRDKVHLMRKKDTIENFIDEYGGEDNAGGLIISTSKRITEQGEEPVLKCKGTYPGGEDVDLRIPMRELH